MKLKQHLGAAVALSAFAINNSPVYAQNLDAASGADAKGPIRRVLLISIDGMHALDKH